MTSQPPDYSAMETPRYVEFFRFHTSQYFCFHITHNHSDDMVFILNTKSYNLGHSIIESKLHIFPIKFTKIKSERLLYRTATTLEAFEQHLMSFRGIHKHCDTCTQILEEGQVGPFSLL